ncbi:MAG TPA: NUDIX domain-containing protein [Candidatus Moranbacteria bacterium]|nr:NUDIX domain-containing protein [Candidatus Moranbacteria bacterium]
MIGDEKFEQFHISQVAVFIRDNKCLIGEFSKWPGRWGLPGGRLDKGERNSEKAFRREIFEEIGLKEFEILGIVDFEVWERKDKFPVSGIVRLIKNENDKIKISSENIQLKWVAENELDDYDFVWPNAKRMLVNGFRFKELIEKYNEKK